MPRRPYGLFGALVALATGGVLIATLPSPKARTPRFQQPTQPAHGWQKRIILQIIGSESSGNPGAQNRNTDGAGLSFGLLQWTQASGNLGKLLVRFLNADPQGFKAIFGAQASLLLQTASAKSKSARMADVGGAALWQSPWTERFAQAGKHDAFIAAQWAEILEGAHWKGGMEAARTLGVLTERSIALCFDRSVQQGPGAAVDLAKEVRARLTTNGRVRVPYRPLLRTYAQLAAARFYAADDDSGTSPGRGWRYHPEHDAWHKHVGPNGEWDLFEIVSKRTSEILANPNLSDTSLALS